MNKLIKLFFLVLVLASVVFGDIEAAKPTAPQCLMNKADCDKMKAAFAKAQADGSIKAMPMEAQKLFQDIYQNNCVPKK